MSLRNLSFVQVFEQFDDLTQFNILTELMKKMDVKEVDLIGKFQKKIKSVADVKWKFTKPRYFQPSFDGPAWKDWGCVMIATHVSGGYIVFINACFINEDQILGTKVKDGKKITVDGFTANISEDSGDLDVDVEGQEEIIKLFKMEDKELEELFE